MIRVIDNIISKKEQENLKNELFDKCFWYFVDDVSIKDNIHQKRPGFKHLFYDNNKITSPFYYLIKPIIDNTKKKTGIGKDLLNARSFLQLPLNRNFIGKGEDTPHLDRRTPHIVFLYYVCDSDGDTIIYDYKSKHAEDVPYKEDVNVLKRVSPKQGRVVVFDGLHWHTAEQPTKDVRCIINFNISTNGT